MADEIRRLRTGLGAALRRAVLRLEGGAERLWRPLSRKLGREKPRSLAAYTGWATRETVVCGARVLASHPVAHPSDDVGWWRNIRDRFRRWESDEVPGVAVTAELAAVRQTVISDAEGYLRFELPLASPLPGSYWQQVRFSVVGAADGDQPPPLEAICRVINPGVEARFGIISDLDDTVIRTGITSLLTAARLTFLGNARTRKPFDGVAALYQTLHTGSADPGAPPRNPLFYVSSSPWNLYDLLDHFLELNGIPRGPLLLQDIGVDETKFIAAGHGHKLDKARRILADYPNLPFVLFGDSGQHDAGLYAELAEEQPERVKAIFIRDVDPARAKLRDEKVALQLRRAEAVGVPMWLVPDSLAAARHLVALGLLPAEALPRIEHDRNIDHWLKPQD